MKQKHKKKKQNRSPLKKKRASSFKTNDLVDLLPAVVYCFERSPSGEMTFKYISHQIRNLLGYSPEEFTHSPSKTFSHVFPEDLPNLLKEVDRSYQTRCTFRWMGRLYNKQGDVKWMQVQSNPTFFPDGRVTWHGVMMDATAQKSNELRLRELQARLFTSQKYIAMGELAGALAHEINTPLAVLQISLDTLESTLEEEDFSPQDCNKVIERMRNVLEKVNSIVTEVKAVSRKGNHTIRTSICVDQLVQDVADLFKEKFERENILFSTEQEISSPPLVYIHPVQITQVLINLVGNSIDALKEVRHQRRLHIHTREEENAIVLEVRDNGPGIPENLLEKIKRPFFTTKSNGTGLGLPLCFKYAKMNGGKLEFVPSKMGACFRLEFPRHQERDEFMEITSSKSAS